MKTVYIKKTGTYNLISVNLQEALIVDDIGIVLAGCVKHKNVIAYNKPLLCDSDRTNDILEIFTSSGFIDKNRMKLIQTDCFSIGFWDKSKQKTTLLN